MIIKAQPHRSSKYFETVCCAGIGRDGKWRRQYPVPFRNLKHEQKFSRWDWIDYAWVRPSDDLREESQKVDPESIVITGSMSKAERRTLLNPLIRKDFDESNSKGESLTLIRPKSIKVRWKKKTADQLEDERQKHSQLSRQLSLLDSDTDDLDPCPYAFRLTWVDQNDVRREHEMDDWETLGAYSRFEREYGEAQALEIIRAKYEEERMKNLVLAFSTHKRRNATLGTNNQWLLVALLSIEHSDQSDMFL